MFDLNLFDHDRVKGGRIDSVLSEIKSILKGTQILRGNTMDKNETLNEFELYEKKKLFLDNKSRSGNDLVWVMDEKSVCVSEDGDGGSMRISQINLPQDASVGKVYEKIKDSYVYNKTLTEELGKIT